MRYEGLDAARRQVELIYGDPEYDVDLRFLKKGSHAITWENCRITPHIWRDLTANQESGYQAYIKPNLSHLAGCNVWLDENIDTWVAVFIDGDDIPIPEAIDWHLMPTFIVSRSPTRWQAWWTDKLNYNGYKWRAVQLGLARHYGTDKLVATPATLMRLAGTLNLKGDTAMPYTLDDFA